jgi:predicted RNase H-like nuclease
MDVYIGFDSAWADNVKSPGAITATQVEDGRPKRFYPPRLVSFEEALDFINEVRAADGFTLLALDQPTIVPNQTSMRPVERAAASLVSWLGGGVQPSNRSKVGMFCQASPIWSFLSRLGADEAPEAARTVTSGLHLIEVFPALALPSIEATFFGRLAGPRYNPQRRKTFKIGDWKRVANAAGHGFEAMAFDEHATWCFEMGGVAAPRKSDQDRLDAMLCLLIGLRWRLGDRSECLMLGCLERGYMVLPASNTVRERLVMAARAGGVPVDGHVPE